jgi:hypothetical protein
MKEEFTENSFRIREKTIRVDSRNSRPRIS